MASPASVAPIGEEKATTSVVKNVNLPKSIGKVFFVDAKNELKWCSATSIQSKYRNLVSTAGHCVYDDKANASVMDNWVFVPGYYQGKTPWGIYVGKTAYVHYDFNVYNDRDRDYAFVTVYNGIQVGGGTTKTVTKAEYDRLPPARRSPRTGDHRGRVQEAGRPKGGETSDAWAARSRQWPSRRRPRDYPGAVHGAARTSARTYYDKAPDGLQDATAPRRRCGRPSVENVTRELKYDAYTGAGYRQARLRKGNCTITHYYTRVLREEERRQEATTRPRFYIVEDFIKDAGRLGDNVGGQGFTWNQKAGQTVYVFGYPAGAHPDGNKAFTGVTPKWCYGKTLATKYVSAADKVEEHVGLKCSMTTGSDGAPWLVKYSSAKRLGYVNGVTSLFGDTDKNGRIDINTSAYFDGETAGCLQQGRRCVVRLDRPSSSSYSTITRARGSKPQLTPASSEGPGLRRGPRPLRGKHHRRERMRGPAYAGPLIFLRPPRPQAGLSSLARSFSSLTSGSAAKGSSRLRRSVTYDRVRADCRPPARSSASAATVQASSSSPDSTSPADSNDRLNIRPRT